MTIVLIAFVGGFAVGVLGTVVFAVYLGAKVAEETTSPLRAAASWPDATIWKIVAGDEVNCRLDLTGTTTMHALGLPQSPGAAIVPAEDVVPANERRLSSTHALELAASKPPVDAHVGAAEPEISSTRPESTNSATQSPRMAPPRAGGPEGMEHCRRLTLLVRPAGDSNHSH